jgi:hypothetical protein
MQQRAGPAAAVRHSRGMDTSLFVSHRERMTTILDALGYGLMPPQHCRECRPLLNEKCERCRELLAIAARVTAAVYAVEDAATDEEAAAVYRACVLGLAQAG